MVEISQNISKITININELSYPVERQRLIVISLNIYVLHKRFICKIYTHTGRSKAKRKKSYIDKYYQNNN